MNQDALRTLVRQKLADGRLPNNHIPRVWGGPGAGETCDACEEVVTKAQLIMEGITLSVGRESVQFHVMCFNVWDAERQVAGHDPSGPAEFFSAGASLRGLYPTPALESSGHAVPVVRAADQPRDRHTRLIHDALLGV
jgi:hypothetical protein